ncbi:MAG: stage II sporulation protein M [Planctomycetes bacterium]|nr:stage II sporulation protein M [Planctomycetota bacterium]
MWERLAGFFQRGFPRAVREVRWHLLAATVALAAGIVAGYVLIGHDAAYYNLLMPSELAGDRGPDSSAESLREAIFQDYPGFTQTFIVFANSLFRHNATVALMAFGLGFMFGLPTVFLLLYNGMIVGAIVRVHVDKGLGVDFVGWLSIHGVTELLAVLLASAAGLAVAQGILFPGRLPRLEGLAVKGRMAAGVAAGAVLMLFVAGIIEGGFRQLIANTPGRYAFAALTGALWLAYFTLAGRRGNVSDD